MRLFRVGTVVTMLLASGQHQVLALHLAKGRHMCTGLGFCESPSCLLIMHMHLFWAIFGRIAKDRELQLASPILASHEELKLVCNWFFYTVPQKILGSVVLWGTGTPVREPNPPISLLLVIQSKASLKDVCTEPLPQILGFRVFGW